ncbi:hypothetical protein ABH920_008614 [Catenulispora sp. EB89]|uniref:RICIN domain-containing protein n=1 Tax=Catenulispora sp. EB89 TaxID=3156257 RepID=UPI003512F16D
MITPNQSPGLRARLLTLVAAVAAVGFGVVAPGSAAAVARPAATPASAPVAIHSGWFGLWAGGYAGPNHCLDSNASGGAYTLPCQVPGNKYQDWNWTEWQAYSPYSGYYYFYSLQNQATGRCLDSNAAGQVYTTNPCQAPGNAYQDWSSPGFTSGWTTFDDVATGRLLYVDTDGSLFTAGAGGDNDSWMPIQKPV